MTRLTDELEETFAAVHQQLLEDEKRHGDTWIVRGIEGQEERIYQRFWDYFLDYLTKGTPIPWLKVIGEAHIALVRERMRDAKS